MPGVFPVQGQYPDVDRSFLKIESVSGYSFALVASDDHLIISRGKRDSGFQFVQVLQASRSPVDVDASLVNKTS